MIPDETYRMIENLTHYDLISPIPTRDMILANIEITIGRSESRTALNSYRLTTFGRELLLCIKPELARFKNIDYIDNPTDWEGKELLLHEILEIWKMEDVIEDIASMIFALSLFRESYSINYRNFGIIGLNKRYSSQVRRLATDIAPGQVGGQIVEAIINRIEEIRVRHREEYKRRQAQGKA
jgi:hypothetical protein